MASQNIAFAFIGGALLVAGGATFAVYKLIEASQAQLNPTVEKELKTVTVVGASRTLYQGVEIRNDDLFVISVPPEYLPQTTDATTGTTVKAEVFRTRERVVGQVPRERILKNELIRPERLADGHAGIGLNAVVARGMRAISIDMKGADAITGFLTPGNYVDVLVTLPDANKELHTEVLLQSVFVLGVNSKGENETDEDVARRGKQKPTVTFMVTPEQAEQIAFAAEMGELSLALRNVQDVIYNAVPVADVNAVLSRVKPRAVEISSAPRTAMRAPTPTPIVSEVVDDGPVIDIIRGGVRFRSTTTESAPLKGDGVDKGRTKPR